MYDDLILRLRDAAKMSEALAVLLPYSEGNATAKLYNEAADAIEELSKRVDESIPKDDAEIIIAEVAKPRWIPVTERLPEFEGAVLCMRKSNVYGVRPYQEILYVDEYGFKNYDDIYLADGVVTHWMPLPEPPEEG